LKSLNVSHQVMKVTFKKGTRVMWNGLRAKVILTDSNSYHNTKILILDTRERTWLSSSDLELDKQYYRDKKLNGMLDE
jgi:hypothetical protein